jgi:formylglycine-generating enzyme required for sulfatase activity
VYVGAESRPENKMTVQATKIHLGQEERLEIGYQGRELRVGTVLWERYEILTVLGANELGELWRCLDQKTGQDVFLRWLPPDLRRSKQVMAVIHAGIRRLSNQTHPNLAAIRQMVYMGEQIYLVGDFAPGVELGAWGRAGAGGKRTLDEVLPVLRQAAAALDFAHGKRIIHRNLKPSNIFLDSDGVVRVTDFGLAPHRHMTIVHGEAVRVGTTGPYLAPELREGEEEPDSASDQYALAALAWNLLAGTPPDSDANGPMPDIPTSARAALRRAMARKPRNRFVTCADFVKALGGERVGGRRRRSASEWRRIRFATEVALALVVLGACLGFGGYMLILWFNTPPEPLVLMPPPRVAEPEKPKPPTRNQGPVERLLVTTPRPEKGKPWVTQAAQMEFIWVPAMQMWVGRFEVTNGEYQQKDAGHDSGDFRGLGLNGSRQPVVRVNFDDATAYAAWLTEQERAAGKLLDGWRYRLPSSIEAITYTRAGGVKTYPWGELWPPTRGNYADASLATAFSDMQAISEYQDGFAATAPVEASGENEWGLFGAGGNAWETTSRAAGVNLFGGWQGGGWDDHVSSRLRCDTLYGFIGNARGAVNGFRLVLAPISEESPPPSDVKEPSAPPSAPQS